MMMGVYTRLFLLHIVQLVAISTTINGFIFNQNRASSCQLLLRKKISSRALSLAHTPNVKESKYALHAEKQPNVCIEYCTGCRWMFRSSWLMQEVLTTFNDELGSVTLVPSKPPTPAGTFLVKLNNDAVLWDRKEEGKFPEAKELKQRIRNEIAPSKDLGHSDVSKEDNAVATSSSSSKCEECEDSEKSVKVNVVETAIDSISTESDDVSSLHKINITYCTGCKWMIRATWICQELLNTFQDEIYSITLTPSRPPEEAGRFIISVDNGIVWDRKERKGFPEAKELKRLVRDIIAPRKALGHIDENAHDRDLEEVESSFEDIDDDNAAEMRSFYGVL